MRRVIPEGRASARPRIHPDTTAGLGRPSEKIAMNPREIELHIEELVLHGFSATSRWDVADSLESELHGLLTERGIPQAWQASPEKIEAGAIQAGAQTNPAVTGKQIARVVYEGGAG